MLFKKFIYWAETIKIIVGCIDIQYLYQKRKNISFVQKIHFFSRLFAIFFAKKQNFSLTLHRNFYIKK